MRIRKIAEAILMALGAILGALVVGGGGGFLVGMIIAGVVKHRRGDFLTLNELFFDILLPSMIVGSVLVLVMLGLLGIRDLRRSRADAKKQLAEKIASLSSLRSQLKSDYQSISQLPRMEFLMNAERHFSSNAYAPFWDSVAFAKSELGELDRRVYKANIDLIRYRELAKKLPGSWSSFGEVPSPKNKVEYERRLSDLEYTAHQDPSFSSAYSAKQLVDEQHRISSEQDRRLDALDRTIRDVGVATIGAAEILAGSLDEVAENVEDISEYVDDHRD